MRDISFLRLLNTLLFALCTVTIDAEGWFEAMYTMNGISESNADDDLQLHEHEASFSDTGCIIPFHFLRPRLVFWLVCNASVMTSAGRAELFNLLIEIVMCTMLSQLA